MPDRRGLSLIELIVASAISACVLGVLYAVLSGSLHWLTLTSAHEQVDAEFLVLREYLGCDVQHAFTIVNEVELDETIYRTATEPGADVLVLQLPAIDAQGNSLSGVFDFAVYTVERVPETGIALRRRLFTTRAADGSPLIGVAESVRMPENRLLARRLVVRDAEGRPLPLFVFDQPEDLTLTRQVQLSVTRQLLESSGRWSTPATTYTAVFRLRNPSPL